MGKQFKQFGVGGTSIGVVGRNHGVVGKSYKISIALGVKNPRPGGRGSQCVNHLTMVFDSYN